MGFLTDPETNCFVKAVWTQTLGVHLSLTPSAEVTGMYSLVWLFTSGNGGGRGVSGGGGCSSDSGDGGDNGGGSESGGELGFWEFKLKSFSEASTFTH